MSQASSVSQTSRARPSPFVRQFSLFLDNKCGRLLEITRLLEQAQIHILGLSVVDLTDSAVARLVTDDPDKAFEVFMSQQIEFTTAELVVVELKEGPASLAPLFSALMQAEVDLYYAYSLIPRPNGHALMAVRVEDGDMAEDALRRQGFNPLRQGDLSR